MIHIQKNKRLAAVAVCTIMALSGSIAVQAAPGPRGHDAPPPQRQEWQAPPDHQNPPPKPHREKDGSSRVAAAAIIGLVAGAVIANNT